ncbi:hypothetical protein FN846DRAFT_893945 [Sphaerosporella brunnea]|uniref:Uncharacterized protein n=1 Tax=Sphaerosporella brunnea TaxID=1250544 RepID=A0A5J5EJ13_9PEZI|nr:hypothetical protein FN846DRAFT_893945 [Sphaerosporella brunnea]
MTPASNIWAQAACTALGYSNISTNAYRALCGSVRRLCPVSLTEQPRGWRDLSPDEQQRYVQRLTNTYPGVRDAQLFMAFVKHVLQAYKGEVKRRLREKAVHENERDDTPGGDPSAVRVGSL